MGASPSVGLDPVLAAGQIKETHKQNDQSRQSVAQTLKSLRDMQVKLEAKLKNVDISDYVESSKLMQEYLAKAIDSLEADAKTYPDQVALALQSQLDELLTLKVMRDQFGIFDSQRWAIEDLIKLKEADITPIKKSLQEKLQENYRSHLRNLVDIYHPRSYKTACKTSMCTILMQKEIEETLYTLRDSTANIDLGQDIILKKTEVLQNMPLSCIFPQLTPIWGLIEELRYRTSIEVRNLPIAEFRAYYQKFPQAATADNNEQMDGPGGNGISQSVYSRITFLGKRVSMVEYEAALNEAGINAPWKLGQ